MKSTSLTLRPGLKARGFTLMELLVVMTIIGILAAMVFPVANGVLKKARKSQAQHTAMQLKQAITTYFTEYSRYPVKTSGGASGDVEVESNSILMDVILGSDKEAASGGLNPRKISFFSGRKAKGKKAGVVLTSDGGGELFDPWGNYYHVILDTNRNDRVKDPSEGGGETIPQSVVVWSNGIDGENEQGKGDDVVTW